MFGMGFWELAVILIIAFLVLGPKKLPQAARTLGQSLRQLRRASEDLRSTIQEPLEEVRRPLEEIRDSLAETVHNVGQEIDREMRVTDVPEPRDLADAATAEERRRVEELYAAAAAEDRASELQEHQQNAEAPPLASGEAKPDEAERSGKP